MKPEKKESPEDKHPTITPKPGAIDPLPKKLHPGKSRMFTILQ